MGALALPMSVTCHRTFRLGCDNFLAPSHPLILPSSTLPCHLLHLHHRFLPLASFRVALKERGDLKANCVFSLPLFWLQPQFLPSAMEESVPLFALSLAGFLLLLYHPLSPITRHRARCESMLHTNLQKKHHISLGLTSPN